MPLNAVEQELTELVSVLKQIKSTRNELLFTKFLPLGYKATTLSSVPAHLFEQVLLTKIRLGTIITLYDDFADNPKLKNSEVLRQLYSMPFSVSLLSSDHPVLSLVSCLWNQVILSIREFPNYNLLKQVFEFDVQQFYTANRYSELISGHPYLANQRENRAYLPHNMGILIAAMIDLMASTGLQINELGRIRSFFHRSQSIARIMNVVSTFEREIKENDITGEIVATLLEQGYIKNAQSHSLDRIDSALSKNMMTTLKLEQESMLQDLEIQATFIHSFDGQQYICGLDRLKNLHESLKGVI